MDASLRGSWVVTPTVRAELSPPATGSERPESPSRPQREPLGGRLGVSVILPLGFTVGGGGELRWTDFEGQWIAAHAAGRGPGGPDAEACGSPSTTGGSRSYGFSPEIVVVNEARETNAQLYDYQRTHGELRFVRQF